VTVYVDQLPPSGWGRWNGGAHMLGNDLAELHAMADRIGLRRSWFQGNSTFAHYDLTASKRRLALAAGAQHIELGEIPHDVLMRREDGEFERRCDRIARREREKAASPSTPAHKEGENG
jgi:Protein of unknown function (DUF4031)